MPFENDLDLNIGYDREDSTEMNPLYFVYDIAGNIIYKGKYSQCLVVVGGFGLDPATTIHEINSKCNGYLFEEN